MLHVREMKKSSRPISRNCSRCCLAVIIPAAMLLLSGCSGTMFTAYPHKIAPMIDALKTGTPVNLDKCLVEACGGSDQILYTMERGRVAHIIGSTDASMRDLNVAMERIMKNDLKAFVSASSLAENVGAVLTNDNILSYTGEGYERVLLHHYQALNYLRKNDVESAGVEVRRANREQEDALKRYESEVENAREVIDERPLGGNGRSVVAARYAQLDEVAGKVKNSFQNAYTFYVSGFIYELLGQPNDAYIDYKKALEIYPENRYLQQDVIRLAAALNMGEDLEELVDRFTFYPAEENASDEHQGELLVIFEDGFAPVKKEIRIAVPIPNAGIIPIAFPIYDERWSPQIPVSIYADNEYVGTTEPICDIRALAVKALKEKAPGIATRQLVRAVAKGAANYEARKKLGDLGALGMSIMNRVTENADLRSWITLPANAQLLRATLPSGVRTITVQNVMGSSASAAIEIPPEGKVLLQVVKTGTRYYLSTTTFTKR